MQALYPYKVDLLPRPVPPHISVCKKDEVSAGRILKIVGENLLARNILVNILAIVRIHLTDNTYFTFKRSDVQNSFVITPIKDHVRRVYISLHNHLSKKGAQGVKCTETLMLAFDETGIRLRGKRGAEKIVRLSFPANDRFVHKRISIMQQLEGYSCFPQNFDFIQKLSGKMTVYQELATCDLATLSEKLPKGLFSLPEEIKISMAKRFTEFLVILKQNGIIHRDIKPENVLVMEKKDGKQEIKLTDFGFACKETDSGSIKEIAGTPIWASAEKLLSLFLAREAPIATPKEDVWSAGAILYHLSHEDKPLHLTQFDDLSLSTIRHKKINRLHVLHGILLRTELEEKEYQTLLKAYNLSEKNHEEVLHAIELFQKLIIGIIQDCKQKILLTLTRGKPASNILTLSGLSEHMLDPDPLTRISSDEADAACKNILTT